MNLMIKGMDMPRNCLLCPCCVGEGIGMGRKHYCQAIDNEPYVSVNYRPEECPLINIPTPHGDLIDRDKLCKKQRNIKLPFQDNLVVYLSDVIEAPAVIEAEQDDG